MSSLLLTIPISFLLSAVLLALVIRVVRGGGFDDWEDPAERHLYDDDATPEVDAAHYELEGDERSRRGRGSPD